MPRKYVTSARRRWRRKTWFNEAGADAPEIPAGVATALKSALASMRPGRMPRKYLAGFDASQVPEQASMRPGRMPRKYRGRWPGEAKRANASMRPGRMPRKYERLSSRKSKPTKLQ